MKQSNELVKNSASNTQGKALPDEYVKRARQLVEERKQKENELRSGLSPASGRDDRLSGQLYQLDIQLQNDIHNLRVEYGLD